MRTLRILILVGLVLQRWAPTSEAPPAPPVSVAPAVPAFSPITLADLPDFKNEIELHVTKKGLVCTNGLVSTVNCEQCKKADFESQKMILSASLSGFNEDIELRVRWQPVRAPLAVILLGFFSKKDEKLAMLWQSRLFAAGCHTVTFDSVLRSEFNKGTRHGAAGNLEKEAELVAKLIGGLMKWGEGGIEGMPKDPISSVRVLGTSYGGLLALNLLKLPQAQTWPIDRALVLSPPLSTRSAAALLDRFHKEDEPRFLPSLLKLLDGYTPDKMPPSPKEESLMRAGISHEFYKHLEEIVKDNERLYAPGLFAMYKSQEEDPARRETQKAEEANLEQRHKRERKEFKNQFDGRGEKSEEYERSKQDMERRQEHEKSELWQNLSHAGDWTFGDYMALLSAPYWKLKTEDLWKKGDLGTLLEGTPPWVQVVMAEDDPLNVPDEVKAFQGHLKDSKVLFLPHGGHLGFAGTKWLEALIARYFKP